MLTSAWSGPARAIEPATVPASVRELATILRFALAGEPEPCLVALGVRLFRRSARLDAAVVTPRAVLAIQFRPGARAFSAVDRRAAEDAALDLADFHAGSRALPILPVVLVPNGALPRPQFPLPLAGAASPLEATRLTFPLFLQTIRGFPRVEADPAAWLAAPYTPVPALLEAACLLYRRHGVAELRTAAAAPEALARARDAIAGAIGASTAPDARRLILLTGAPGTGKTLVGLDLAFATDAAFLTANPTLIHVLRQALVRDASAAGADPRAASRRIAAVIQPLPERRDHLVATGAAPSERVLVVDEAQRCWSREHAASRTRNKPVRLPDSEPAILLDAMARRCGPSVLIALVGTGQEIHHGEAGLEGWADALRTRPEWRVLASPQAAPSLEGAEIHPDLHLAHPVRAVRRPDAIAWVDAVLADRPGVAAALAPRVGVTLTRSLSALRRVLQPRGNRTAGLLASAHAARLRAEGLGVSLPHQDEAAVAHWFLDRWPDIRSADALEVTASEFAVQGLELDRVGLCWDLDLIRRADAWAVRRFRGNRWTAAGTAATANTINAYRVLLTRARHGTTIFVPRGNPADATRDLTLYDEVAAYLAACGAEHLDETVAEAEDRATIKEEKLL